MWLFRAANLQSRVAALLGTPLTSIAGIFFYSVLPAAGSQHYLTGYWDLSSVPAGLLVCIRERLHKFVHHKFIRPRMCHYDRGSCLRKYRTVFPLATVTSSFLSCSYRKCQFGSSSTPENIVIGLHLLQSPATGFNRHTSSFAHRARFRRVHRNRQCNQGLIGNPDISPAA